MDRELEYRGYAVVMLDVAKGAAYAADKFRLLALADAWLKLALKSDRHRRRQRNNSILACGTVSPDQRQAECGYAATCP